MKINNLDRPYILIGCGGYAGVIFDLLNNIKSDIYGVCDPSFKDNEKWNGLMTLHDDNQVFNLDPDKFFIANGMGGYGPYAKLRKKLSESYEKKGFIFPPLVHTNTSVSNLSSLHSGVQIMSGAIVQANCVIKKNTIINTNASIDHDVKIEKNSSISPGTTICGTCNIGKDVFIGAGVTIINGISIGDNSFVKAGTLVKSDITLNKKL